MLDPLDVLLMEGNLLQGEDLPIIVFCSAADQILADWSQREGERVLVYQQLNRESILYFFFYKTVYLGRIIIYLTRHIIQ